MSILIIINHKHSYIITILLFLTDTIDDKKLKVLFNKEVRRVGVSPHDLNSETIKAIQEKHWPTRTYRGFSVLFKNKARQFNIAREKEGSRKKTTGKLLSCIPLFLQSSSHLNFSTFISFSSFRTH